jgi:hypothetical protein
MNITGNASTADRSIPALNFIDSNDMRVALCCTLSSIPHLVAAAAREVRSIMAGRHVLDSGVAL